MHGRMSMFLLGATLALGFSLSAYIIGQAAVKVTKNNNIRVKGSAMRLVKSDSAMWSGTVSARNADLQTAFRKIESDRTAVSEFLRKAGFKDSEFKFGSIGIAENLRRDAKGNLLPFVEDYTLSQGVTVTSPNVDAVENVSRESTALVGQGVFFRSGAASYVISDLERFKMELLSEATKNGTERAEVLAKNSGGKVGALLSASQGIFQITAPASGAMSDMGEYDKSTIMKEVKAVVTLEFRVE